MVIGMAGGKKKILVVSMAYLFLLVSVGASPQIGKGKEAEADRITQLPGQPKVPFQQYSGYVTVNKKAGRALFYWLTEAVIQPESKPLMIWFNGGPGCSSVAFGASEEIGPFKIKKNGTGLYLNKFSWNSEANLLFLESPAGVGFSYSNTSSDMETSSDERTATDALEFIIRWLDRFPHYKQRVIYLTGESYAGHYVPQLAQQILRYNSRSKYPINLKGILIGNPVIDRYYDNIGTTEYQWTHAMMSDDTHNQILQKCDFYNQTYECLDITSHARDMIIDIDSYSIYTPKCKNLLRNNATPSKILHLPHRPLSILWRLSGYDPCVENNAEIYYNRPDVQKALHANTTKIPYHWIGCNHDLLRSWNNESLSVLPIYKEMIAAGLRIWVFSGDVDAVVPVTASRLSLAQLKLKTKMPWYPWYVKPLEVGGRAVVYEGLTFATVRGAGHEVPVLKPKSALILLKSFLSGTPLPKS